MHLPSTGPTSKDFLTLPEVSATLLSEAGLVVHPKYAEASGETALGTMSYPQPCPTGYILTSPEANQCCYDGTQTLFVRSSDNTVITRAQSPNNLGCEPASGSGSCAGSACYYGPAGFATAVISGPYSQPVVSDADYEEYVGFPCENRSNQGLGIIFPSEEGSFPRGQGCPGTGSQGSSDVLTSKGEVKEATAISSNSHWDY
jgi:hypothetical protein